MKSITINIKLIIYSIIFMSTIIIVSSINIFIIWISIELNLFSFVLLLINDFKRNEIEASINYFLSQALGSILFLIIIAVNTRSHWFSWITSILLIIAITLKLGIVPCHYWFPATIRNIRWINCLILSTWQKIGPLFIIAYVIKSEQVYIAIIATINALIGRIMGLRQLSLKKIIAYSSIAHIGWTIAGISIKIPCLSITYFIFYLLISMPLFIIFNLMKINFIYESWKSTIRPILKFSTIVLFLSLGGLPPLTGFMPKLLIINILLNYRIIIVIVLLISSLITLFFYLNIRLNIFILLEINKILLRANNTYNFINIIARTRLLGLITIIL